MFEWAPLLQAELMSVSVASLQAVLVLLPVLVEMLLPARAVGQMWVPRLSPEVMKALKLVAEPDIPKGGGKESAKVLT